MRVRLHLQHLSKARIGAAAAGAAERGERGVRGANLEHPPSRSELVCMTKHLIPSGIHI